MSLEGIAGRWVGRREQIELLGDLIDKHATPVSRIFIFGAAGTGKTSIILEVLKSLDAVFSYSDCRYLCNMGTKHLFENIAMQLARQNEKMFQELRKGMKKEEDLPMSSFEAARKQQLLVNQRAFASLLLEPLKGMSDLLPTLSEKKVGLLSPAPSNSASSDSPGISLTPIREGLRKTSALALETGEAESLYTDKSIHWGAGLNKLLSQIVGLQWIEPYPAFIVLDNMESLQRDSALLAAFSCLADATSHNICLIFIGQDASAVASIPSCVPVHFPTYNPEDLMSIILQQLASDAEAQCGGPENLKEFVQYVVLATEHATRDLVTLRHYIKSLLVHYVEIIKTLQASRSGEAVGFPSTEAVTGMFGTRLRPFCLQLFAKDNPEYGRPSKKAKSIEGDKSRLHALISRDSSSSLDPLSTWMALGLVLAKHTPPQHDRRMFTHTATKKLSLRNFKKADVSLAPKPLSLERVVAITESVMDPALLTSFRVNHLAVLGQLVTLRYVDKSDDFGDSMRVRCLIDLELAEALAATVNFDLASYLIG